MIPDEKCNGVPKYKQGNVDARIGIFAEYTVALVLTEQGIEAEEPLKDALELFLNAEAIIGVGVGYGVDRKQVKLGDVMVSKTIVDSSTLEINKDGVMARNPKISKVEKSLLDCFNDADNQYDWSRKFPVSDKERKSVVRPGNIVSGSALVKYEEFKEQLLKHVHKPVGGEMEGWVLIRVAEHYRDKNRDPKPAVITIKAVADYGDEHKDKEWQPIAAQAAVDYVHFCLKRTDKRGTFSAVSIQS